MKKKMWWVALSVVLASCSTVNISAEEKQDVLAVHNQLRALHHAPALKWDDKLAAYAARYAGACYFKHSKGPYGENLAAGYPSIKAAVKAWYDEKQAYDYAHPGFSMKTGHFTQVVWKSTRYIGCAYVACDGEHGTPGNYLVCEYGPPGNVMGDEYFTANVA